MRRPLIAALCFVMLAAACGDSDVDQVTSGATSSSSTTTPTTTSLVTTTSVPTTSAPTTTVVPSTTASTATSSTAPTTTTAVDVPGVLPDCSAAGLAAPPTPPELGEAAASTYRLIVDAAVACDVALLAEIAGEEITLTFGGPVDVAPYFADAEARSTEILRILVQLLAMPAGYQDEFEIWVWPTFWQDDEPATPEEQAAIEVIFGVPFDDLLVEDLYYINFRIGIDTSGDWLYFVAGD